MWWELILSGALVGALVGLTGMGGGSLMTPLLVIVFGFNPTVAIGTDIAHGAIFKTAGGIRHRRLGTVHARLGAWMFMTSAPMSLVGVWLASWLERKYGDGAQSAMGKVLAVGLLLGAGGLIAKSFVHYHERSDAPFLLTRRDRIAALAIGFFGGFIVGLTSVGTGVFFGLTMLIVFPLRAAKIVGTDIFHAAALLWVAGMGHFVAGNVDMRTVGWLAIGSVPGVLICEPVHAAGARARAAPRPRERADVERPQAAGLLRGQLGDRGRGGGGRGLLRGLGAGRVVAPCATRDSLLVARRSSATPRILRPCGSSGSASM